MVGRGLAINVCTVSLRCNMIILWPFGFVTRDLLSTFNVRYSYVLASKAGEGSRHKYTACVVIASGLQGLIPEVVPSQKCHMKTRPIPSAYGAMDRN